MRSVLGIVMMVIGLPLIVAGVAVAFVTGPDDTVEFVREDISTEQPVISTSESLVNITGATMHVSANAGDKVFVGAAHPVHVDSYLDGVGQENISRVSWRGDVTSNPVTGEKTTPDVPPEGLDWWRESATGTGTQHISYDLSEEPVRIVVTRPSPGAPLDVTFVLGIQVEGVFVSAVLVTICGALLVGGGTLLRRSRRRSRRRARRRDEGAEADRTDVQRTPPPAPPEPPPRPTVRLAVIGTLGLALGGCAAIPQQIDEADRPVSVPAITAAAAEDFFAQYSKTIGDANAALDRELIATVETGTLLKTSQFSYEERRARGNPPAEPPAMAPSLVAAPKFDAYPMWSVVKTTGPEGKAPAWYLITRENAASSWLASLAVRPDDDVAVPPPLIEGRSAVLADDDVVDRGVEALNALVSFGTTGATPEGIDLTYASGVNRLPTHGLQLDDAPREFGTVDRTCSLDNPERIPWLATEPGAMTLASISCTQTMLANSGYSVVVEDGGFGVIPGGTEIVESTITQSASFALFVDADGSATVIGQPLSPVTMSYTEAQNARQQNSAGDVLR